MKRLLIIAICLAFAVAPKPASAVPMAYTIEVFDYQQDASQHSIYDVYRSVQYMVYFCFDGSKEGIQIGNWMLQYYGITVWDLWAYVDGGGDMNGVMGNIHHTAD